MNLRMLFTTRGVILWALTAMVALSFISYSSITKLNRLAGLVDHTHVVQLNLQKTNAALSDADSELKTFLITKDSSYYQTLLEEENLIRQSMLRLNYLTQDNEAQQKRISSLDSLIHARWTFMDASLKGDEGHYEYFAAQIETCNKLLKASIQSLNAKEEELLAARSVDSSSFQNTAPITLLSIQILVGICLLIGFNRVTADVKAKERLRVEALQANKELKEQRDFIQGIFDNTVDVIMVFDTELNVVALNGRGKELYDPNNIAIGKNIIDLYPQGRGTHFLQGIHDALIGKHGHSPAKESAVHQGVFYESFFVPLYSAEKNIIGAMAIHHDVSKLIKMTHEVQAINDQLQKSNHELEQFAYVTSHDLQEPLRKIRTFADIANQNIESKETVSKNLKKLSASAERMSLLIRDILNYSRLANAESKSEEVDLNDVLEQVLEDFELVIGEKDAIIESTRLPIIMGSQQQLTQVFNNIISNALKFCTAAPCIKIGCRQFEGNYEITFSDNGIGFDEQYAQQIFRVFQRLHHRSEFSGTGIGLALCKRIVENHGGSIKASSTPNKGTVFTITLPDLIAKKRVIIPDLHSLQNSVKSSLSFGLVPMKNEGLQEPFVSE
jgi:signal transduction histidine kinase/CHASE3 domain sensor protein